MSERREHILDATAENFETAVLENSHKGPVLVNFWSPKAGPCLRLWPVLEKLAEEYAGRFLLVNLNVDRLRRLAEEHGVASVPTVKLFHHGRVVETVRGYEHEGTFRTLLDRHVPPASAGVLVQALHEHRAGRREAALDRLREAASEDPEDHRILVTLVKLLIQAGRHAEAETYLHSLPRSAWSNRESSGVLAHLSFLLAAQNAPPASDLERFAAEDPADCDTRYTLAAIKLADDDYEQAMDYLLQILAVDPAFRDGAAVRGLTALFNLLGGDDPRVDQCRERMLEMLS